MTSPRTSSSAPADHIGNNDKSIINIVILHSKTLVEEQIKGNDRYQVIDIGAHVKNLKEFLRLRDSSPAFDGARRSGAAGIPCLLLEDGTVTLVPEEAGLRSRPVAEGASCGVDGSGC